MTKKRNQVGKYTLFQTLGEGTFGKVKYATHFESSQNFAIKVLDKQKIQQQNMGTQMKREISIMKLVNNPHVVKMEEVLASKTKIYLVLELVTGGELFDEIVREGHFSEEKARFYFRQLVWGVEYCHGKGVCHRDLKPENLLLDGNGNLKISDFGLSALYTGDEVGGGGAGGGGGDDVVTTSSRASLLHTTCGTPNYVAPEVLEDRGYDGFCADVWSMGVILYVLVSGCLPFDEPTMAQLFHKIQKAEFKFPPKLSHDLKDLISRILVADPSNRITIAQIKKHIWFTKSDKYKPYNASQARTASCTQPSSPQKEQTTQHLSIADQLSLTSSTTPENKSKTQQSSHRSAAATPTPTAAAHNVDSNTSKRPSFTRDSRFVLNSTEPPSFILTKIKNTLTTLNCNIIDKTESLTCTSISSNSENDNITHKVRAVKMTPRGMIGMGIILRCRHHNHKPPPATARQQHQYEIDIRRGKGDIMEYHKLFRDVKDVLSRSHDDNNSLRENDTAAATFPPIDPDEFSRYMNNVGLRDSCRWNDDENDVP